MTAWHWRDTERGRFRVNRQDWLSNRDLHDRGYNSRLHGHLAQRRWHSVIDAGANTGQSMLMFASYCDHIVSCEPIPELFAQLEITRSENCVDHCDTIQTALWDRGCELTMNYRSNNSLASQVDPQGTVRVPAVTIDDLAQRPDLIKIDCEGSDLRVLMGARDTIRRCRPHLVLEMKHSIQPVLAIQQWLVLMGYEPDPLFAQGRGRNIIYQPQVVK